MSIKKHILLLLALSLCVLVQGQTVLRGTVKSALDGEPIPFATIYAKEMRKGVVADNDGRYELRVDDGRDCHIRVQSLGYQPREILVPRNEAHLDIVLDEQSIALSDFTVTAKYLDKVGSDATIGQEALEYIQPTSLKDIFVLLPGGKIGSDNMQNSSLISSRQVGADLSSSFGMGVSVNGVSLNNDGMRIQMQGVTGSSSADGEGNVRVNAGMDLRTLSSDHIESVTVVRGISSAKEGNLSSGSIQVQAKQGASPLHSRVKFDPQNKLAYVGKGFRLSDALGTLHMGADIVRSQSQIEDERGAYNRVSGQLNWNNQRHWAGKVVNMNVLGSYVTSFSNRKTDEMIEAYHEKYNSRYQRASLSSKMKMELGQKWIDDVELILAADYSDNSLEHHKHVINRTVMPLQHSTVEGENEGIYLPSSYDTYYEIDNRPLNCQAQIDAQKYGVMGERWNYSMLLGSMVNVNKNLGAGAVFDLNRPPFPSSDCIRPRKNSDIPAIAHQAGYAEVKLRHRAGERETNLSIGLRETMMFNLPSEYLLNGKVLLDPRMQGSYTLYHDVRGKVMSHTLRLGWGIENKLPSADYLYPDKVYHDYIALNAYFTDESQRLLITNTKIQNPTNPRIDANRNYKIEGGYDGKWNGYEWSITAFSETMKGGVEYFTTYAPASYTYYYALSHEVTGRPTREDFLSRTMETFMAMRVPTNSARVEKRGIEYRLHIPTIEPLRSDIEVNGAYYHTVYSSGVPVMYRPSIMVNDQMYPYVGIYDGFEKEYAENFNTNFWINTHIPDWKLIFTNFIQIIWFQRSHLGTDVSEYPEHYMDTAGEIHPFDLTDDAQLERLRRSFLSSRYNGNALPVSLLWNIKATKEFNRHAKLSFFANNIIQVSPKYQDGYAHTQRNWYKPFFGGELSLNF